MFGFILFLSFYLAQGRFSYSHVKYLIEKAQYNKVIWNAHCEPLHLPLTLEINPSALCIIADLSTGDYVYSPVIGKEDNKEKLSIDEFVFRYIEFVMREKGIVSNRTITFPPQILELNPKYFRESSKQLKILEGEFEEINLKTSTSLIEFIWNASSTSFIDTISHNQQQIDFVIVLL